jgi:hypothetical protein
MPPAGIPSCGGSSVVPRRGGGSLPRCGGLGDHAATWTDLRRHGLPGGDELPRGSDRLRGPRPLRLGPRRPTVRRSTRDIPLLGTVAGTGLSSAAGSERSTEDLASMGQGFGAQAVSDEGANVAPTGQGFGAQAVSDEGANVAPTGQGFGAQAVSDEGANVAPTGAEEPACKPDPVPGPKPRRRPSVSARRRVAPPRRRVAVRPRRAAYPAARAGRPRTLPAWPCSGWGLPSRRGRPRRWCALTAPFHPYPSPKGSERGGLLSAAPSRGRPRLGLPSTLPCGVRTFLDRAMRGRGRPAGSSTSRVPSTAPPPATGRRRCSRGRRPRCSPPAGRARRRSVRSPPRCSGPGGAGAGDARSSPGTCR